PHLVQRARESLRHGSDDGAHRLAAARLKRSRYGLLGRYLRAPTATSRAVRIQGPSAITATVCSKCAERLPSRVTAVQPSASTFTAGLPAFTIGSIASTIPSVSRGPRPGSP